MRHASPAATEAFWRLVETDDALLTTEPVRRLLVFLGNDEPAEVRPVVERMLVSQNAEVREVGGYLAAVAAMDGASPTILKLC